MTTDPYEPEPSVDTLVDEVFGELALDSAVRSRARSLVRRLRSESADTPVLALEDAESALSGRIGRYSLKEELGRGGMGLVLRVHDHRLNRTVAMKVLRPDRAARPGLQARFIEEAQTTAQLDHPGVVPVHDFGWLPDGRTYYTMQEVCGDHLADVIARLHGASSPSGFARNTAMTFRRLIDVFRLACEAVGYAHSRGVLHRDLKPENILVGEFGEVYVVDWGLARLLGTTEASVPVACEPPERAGDTVRRSETRFGATLGTPGFMAPEQHQGLRDEIGPPADVFSMGVVLFQLLTNRRCDLQEPAGTMQAQQKVLIQHPHGLRVPEVLRRICLRAVHPDPSQRYKDGRALAGAVTRWLEGAERRAQALEMVEKADALRPELARMRHKQRELRRLAAQWLDRVPPERPVPEKRRAWRWESEAEQVGRSIERAEVTYVELLTGALQNAPDLPEARTRLAEFYRAAHARAESAGDALESTRMEARLRTFDDGSHTEWLRGDGALSLVTNPPGVRARIVRYVLRDRRMVPGELVDELSTPIERHRLPKGRYLVYLEHPGHEPVRYPVWIPRCHSWTGQAPGDDGPHAVVMPQVGSLGPDEVYVPAGWFRVGDDPSAYGALPAGWIWVDAFVMRRFPITNREYIAFLEDLVQMGEDRTALQLAPRPADVNERQGALLFQHGPAGGLGVRAVSGEAGSDPLGPVVMIPHAAAEAYARWLSERTNVQWRLPGEIEWEKAARGVDGRRYPWGDFLDPTWACTREAHPVQPGLALVDTHRVDESPYGVRGMGGNVREWCADVFQREGPSMIDGRATIRVARNREVLRAVRGGCWADIGESGARSARREGVPATVRAPWLGFRLVRSL